MHTTEKGRWKSVAFGSQRAQNDGLSSHKADDANNSAGVLLKLPIAALVDEHGPNYDACAMGCDFGQGAMIAPSMTRDRLLDLQAERYRRTMSEGRCQRTERNCQRSDDFWSDICCHLSSESSVL